MEQDLFEFLNENKKLLQGYAELRIRIFKLELIRTTSRISGIILWFIISLLFIFMVFLFAGLTTGFLLSSLLHSYTAGFGITTLLILAIVVLLTVFRKKLFINPIIRVLILQQSEDEETAN